MARDCTRGGRVRRRFGAALRPWAAACLLLATASRAADLPRLALLPPLARGIPAEVRDRFGAILRGELSAAGPAASEAQRALAQGKKLIAEREFGPALAALRKGISLALEDPASVDFPALVDAHLLLAVAAFREGEDRAAQAALAQAVRLDPELALAPGRFPPVFSHELEKAKAKVAGGGLGSAVIDGPPGAQAFLDGRPLGPVPAKADRLPAGVHYAWVEEGGRRAAREIELSASRPAQVTLSPSPAPAAAPVLTAELASRLSEYARAAGAADVLLVVLSADGASVRADAAVYSAGANAFAALPPVLFGQEPTSANAAALELADGAAARIASLGPPLPLPFDLLERRPPAPPKVEAPPAAVAVVPPPAAGPARADLFRRVPWWVWAAGAGAVVAAAGTAGILYANRPVTGSMTVGW